MAEVLMVQAVMVASAFEQAAGNKAQLKAIGDAVAKGAEASGLKLNKMMLTEKGFGRARAARDQERAALRLSVRLTHISISLPTRPRMLFTMLKMIPPYWLKCPSCCVLLSTP
jgi:hypothetical protein